MSLHRITSAAVLGILILALAACSGTRVPVVPATVPVSPLPVKPAPSVQPEATSLSAESPLATPPAAVEVAAPTPGAGKGGVAGRLIDYKTGQPMANQNLSLPSIVCPPGVAEENKREECVYAIDDAFDPSTLTDQQGRFVFNDVTPGDYVLLVGNRMTKSTVLADDASRPLMWKVAADEVLKLGDLLVDLQ